MLMARAVTTIDKISSLPDSVLCDILSFLPTKVAAATSVLSKRWRQIWLSVPNLEFFQSYGDNNEEWRFTRMVYAVLLKKDPTLPVKSFCLHCCHCDPSDVITWTNTVIQRGVEHLDLDLPLDLDLHLHLNTRMNLPSGILGSRTLVVLKLDHLTVNGVFTDGFPSLKIMHLFFVTFEEQRYLVQLLSGCPVLEKLNACHPRVDNLIIEDGDGEIQSLQKLVTVNLSMAKGCFPLKSICNAEYLRIREELPVPDYNVTCTFSNLTFLELSVMNYNWDWLIEVLQHCPRLQILEISKDRDSDIGMWVQWVQPLFVPVPECLLSHLRTCFLTNFQGWKCELEFAKYIMKNAKVLRSLQICIDACLNLEKEFKIIRKLSMCPRSSPTCELSFE